MLVSDSPKSIDLTISIRDMLGQMLTTTETIQPQQKLAINIASEIVKAGGSPYGAFSQGSVAIYFMGTIMPVAGQMTVTNPALSLTHQVDMVENDPGRSDIPAVLNGAWWGLGGGNEAQVFVSNTGDTPQFANIYLAFQGKRHEVKPALMFKPYETKALDIAKLLEGIGVDPAEAPSGGITIIQAGPNPALIASGKITDPATGFSSTIDFPNPQLQRASALDAVGLPIGKPTKDSPYAGAGYFTPHVVVRNLLSTPQTVTITVEYPQPSPAAAAANHSTQIASASSVGAPLAAPSTKPRMIVRPRPLPGDKNLHPEWGAGTGSTTGSAVVASFSLAGYSTSDFSLAAAMNNLPLPLPFCSIRIQYSGAPGSAIADVSSVEKYRNLIVDAKAENEGNGWAGSGANPWHLDKNTDSVLFLTNMGNKPCPIGFDMTADGVHYYLTSLKLNPHETRAIDLRALRDAQLADFKGNKIPTGATDGSIDWIRLDDLPVMGRLMVISRKGGISSSYDCYDCCCPAALFSMGASPDEVALAINGVDGLQGFAGYQDCDGVDTFFNVTDDATWTSEDPSVIEMVAGSPGKVEGVAGGSTYIHVSYTASGWLCDGGECVHYGRPIVKTGSASATVQIQAKISSTTLSGNTIHTQDSPTEVTLTVSVWHQAFATSENGSVTVEVGSYSGVPPGNNVTYVPASRALPLSGAEGYSTETFEVTGATEAGSVIIQSTLTNPSSDVLIETPSAAQSQATLNTANP